MYYVRTTGGSMMAITPRATTSVTVKKDTAEIKAFSSKKKPGKKKS